MKYCPIDLPRSKEYELWVASINVLRQPGEIYLAPPRQTSKPIKTSMATYRLEEVFRRLCTPTHPPVAKFTDVNISVLRYLGLPIPEKPAVVCTTLHTLGAEYCYHKVLGIAATPLWSGFKPPYEFDLNPNKWQGSYQVETHNPYNCFK